MNFPTLLQELALFSQNLHSFSNKFHKAAKLFQLFHPETDFTAAETAESLPLHDLPASKFRQSRRESWTDWLIDWLECRKMLETTSNYWNSTRRPTKKKFSSRFPARGIRRWWFSAEISRHMNHLAIIHPFSKRRDEFSIDLFRLMPRELCKHTFSSPPRRLTCRARGRPTTSSWENRKAAKNAKQKPKLRLREKYESELMLVSLFFMLPWLCPFLDDNKL